MTLCISGYNSKISQQLMEIIDGEWKFLEEIIRGEPLTANFPVVYERYFFCHGLLRSKPESKQTEAEIIEGLNVNFSSIKYQCDRILRDNSKARICVMGSQSGYAGSYDGVYACAKHKLHEYIEKKVLQFPEQQLVGVAPSIIEDAGMTTRRDDLENLEQRKADHPKKRFLTSYEVAQMVYHLLYVDSGYTTGTVIRMHGGLK